MELALWAFILALAYLPLPFGFLAWIALARPIAIISQLDSKTAFKAGYFYSFMANLFQLYWIGYVTPPGMVAAIFLLSLYPATVLWMFNKIFKWKSVLGIIALPILWVGMEYFRSLTELSFPWTDLSYSQAYYLSMIQIVSVIGAYGLSLLVMALNIFIWKIFSKSSVLETRMSLILAFIGVIGVLYLYGWVVLPKFPEDGNIRISLLQGDVDLSTKWQSETRTRNFTLYDSLAVEASKEDPGLIIWPETAAPAYPNYELGYLRMLQQTARRSGASNIFGALDQEQNDGKRKSYNSAFQISELGEKNGVYHKIKLVPFSERSPYQEEIPFLTRDFLQKYITAIETHDVQWWSNFYSGDSIVLFEFDSIQYVPLICYECAFPEFVRESILKGASFLVNITNDTWFGYTPGPFQHLRIALMRAVENRIWLARCANTGISAVVDPYGRIRTRGELYERKVLTYNIQPLEEYSVFTKIGPVVGRYSWYITFLLFICFIILKFVCPRYKSKPFPE
ncbi:MAG: apolipoprotein N-acyltransferase [Candidatus Zixiibacteriota bacterium]